MLTAADIQALQVGGKLSGVIIGGVNIDGTTITNPVFAIWRSQSAAAIVDVCCDNDTEKCYTSDQYGDLSLDSMVASEAVAMALTQALIPLFPSVTFTPGSIDNYQTGSQPNVVARAPL